MGEGIVVTLDSPVSREKLFFYFIRPLLLAGTFCETKHFARGTNLAYIALK